jgi:cytochrome c-type biogenesis protein
VPSIAALFIIFCGLVLMDIPPFSKLFPSFALKQYEQRGPVGAFMLGLVYGVLLGPCTFAFLAPLIGFVFSAALSQVAYGLVLMILYSIGHVATIVVAGTFGDFVRSVLQNKWSQVGSTWLKRGLGVLVVFVGIATLIQRL